MRVLRLADYSAIRIAHQIRGITIDRHEDRLPCCHVGLGFRGNGDGKQGILFQVHQQCISVGKVVPHFRHGYARQKRDIAQFFGGDLLFQIFDLDPSPEEHKHHVRRSLVQQFSSGYDRF
ncbi:hypothetical protein D3C77_604270 [compost metagenome]